MFTKNDLRLNRSAGAIFTNMLLATISLFANGFGVYLTIQANIGVSPSALPCLLTHLWSEKRWTFSIGSEPFPNAPHRKQASP